MKFSLEAEFEYIVTLLQGNEWPSAVPPELVYLPSKVEDHHKRAKAIFDQFFNVSLKNKKVLDFGCGEGFLTLRIAQAEATISVGYDIKQGKHVSEWEQTNQNYLLTTDLNRVKHHAPYDIIILYDVIDHLINDNIYEMMHQIRCLSTKGTIVMLRSHPWTSRNSESQLSVLNRAFSRLILHENEAQTLSLDTTNRSNKLSLSSYRDAVLDNPLRFMPAISFKYHPRVWLTESIVEAPTFFESAYKYLNRSPKRIDWLSLSSEYIHHTAVELFFFQNKIIKERIKANLNNPIFQLPIIGDLLLRNFLEITYVDYILVVN